MYIHTYICVGVCGGKREREGVCVGGAETAPRTRFDMFDSVCRALSFDIPDFPKHVSSSQCLVSTCPNCLRRHFSRPLVPLVEFSHDIRSKVILPHAIKEFEESNFSKGSFWMFGCLDVWMSCLFGIRPPMNRLVSFCFVQGGTPVMN